MLKTIITKLYIYIGIVNKYLVIFWSLKSIPLRVRAIYLKKVFLQYFANYTRGEDFFFCILIPLYSTLFVSSFNNVTSFFGVRRPIKNFDFVP